MARHHHDGGDQLAQSADRVLAFSGSPRRQGLKLPDLIAVAGDGRRMKRYRFRRLLRAFQIGLQLLSLRPEPDEVVADIVLFDATPHAEFLYECVERTINLDLPAETRFLRAYDDFRGEIARMVDMPDRTVDLFFRFLRQNDGKLLRRARTQEFRELTENEVAQAERAYANCLAGEGEQPG